MHVASSPDTDRHGDYRPTQCYMTMSGTGSTYSAAHALADLMREPNSTAAGAERAATKRIASTVDDRVDETCAELQSALDGTASAWSRRQAESMCVARKHSEHLRAHESLSDDMTTSDSHGQPHDRTSAVFMRDLSRPIARRDRIAPVPAERAVADPHARRRLAALVFVALHHLQHAADRRAIEAARGDFVHRQIVFDEQLEDRRRALRTAAANPNPSDRGAARPRAAARSRAAGSPARSSCDSCASRYTSILLQSLIGAKPPAMSPYKRGVADRHFALVAGRQHHAAGLVRDRHQQQAAAARLDVLFRRVRLRARRTRPSARRAPLRTCLRSKSRRSARRAFAPAAAASSRLICDV